MLGVDAKRPRAYYEQTDIVERNLADLNTLSVRVRSAVKGIYGADSAEYKSVGGKRLSEHKKPTKKTPVAP